MPLDPTTPRLSPLGQGTADPAMQLQAHGPGAVHESLQQPQQQHLQLQPQPGTSAANSALSAPTLDMPFADKNPPLDILIHSEPVLRGAGTDITPAHLAGVVVLHLTEDTAIREITLSLKGKARIPASQTDGHARHQTYVVYSHDWSFLQGEKKHSHTLKAGRHEFPFDVQLDDSVPSTLFIHDGNATVNYRLRATAVRPALATNFIAVRPVTVVRALVPEALEYQQTLEIENTWPEKIMYSIMLPHKAWAAGDPVTALLKFVPLAKGVRVLSITSSVTERIKIVCKTHSHEDTRTIASVKHDIHDGHAHEVVESRPLSESHRQSSSSSISAFGPRSWASRSILNFHSTHSTAPEGTQASSSSQHHAFASTHPIPEEPAAGPSDEGEEVDIYRSDDEVNTCIKIPLPITIAPTHSCNPIITHHRIKWEVVIANLDGHNSELRCSLPIHVLAPALASETRVATHATHSLLFGESESSTPSSPDPILPSYNNHVLDRVPNANLNPTALLSSAYASSAFSTAPPSPHSDPISRDASPRGAGRGGSLPTTPGSSMWDDLVGSEFLLSLGQARHHNFDTPPESRVNSRHSSRAPSPEPGGSDAPSSIHSSTGAQSRRTSRHGLFNLKPFTALHSSSRRQQPAPPPPPTATATAPESQRPSLDRTTSADSASASIPRTTSVDRMELLRNAYNTVPDYDISASGPLGGGLPPIDSLRGLPSYDEAARSEGNSPNGAPLSTTPSRDTPSSSSSSSFS